MSDRGNISLDEINLESIKIEYYFNDGRICLDLEFKTQYIPKQCGHDKNYFNIIEGKASTMELDDEIKKLLLSSLWGIERFIPFEFGITEGYSFEAVKVNE